MMVSETMVIKNSLFKNLSLRIDGGDLYGSEKLAQNSGYVTHNFRYNKFIWDVPYSTFTHEARGPGLAFLYIPRIDISNNIFNVIDKGVSLGSLFTLRIFTENFLQLLNNTIVTSNVSNTTTRGTITIDGSYRKNGIIPVPKTAVVDQGNTIINSHIRYTNNVK
jgi:hypothetical protein